MGSFVPLGGFFSTPSEFKKGTDQSTRCDLCNEKYEQEVSITLKGGSNTSVSDQYSESVSSWLQKAEYDTSKGLDMVKVCTMKILTSDYACCTYKHTCSHTVGHATTL